MLYPLTVELLAFQVSATVCAWTDAAVKLTTVSYAPDGDGLGGGRARESSVDRKYRIVPVRQTRERIVARTGCSGRRPYRPAQPYRHSAPASAWRYRAGDRKSAAFLSRCGEVNAADVGGSNRRRLRGRAITKP